MQGVDYLMYGERLLVLAMVSANFEFASWRSLMLGWRVRCGEAWRVSHTNPATFHPGR
jgi:hypothetical protein